MVLEVNSGYLWREGRVVDKGAQGGFWGAESILFFDPSGNYTGIFIL